MPGTDILLEAHENRLQDLERDVSSLSSQLLPALARLEATMVHGFKDVNARLDRGEERFERIEESVMEVKKVAADAAAIDVTRDGRLQALEKAEAERAEIKKGFRKWVLGGIGTLVLAAVLAALGLK